MEKVKRKIWLTIVSNFKNKGIYFFLYGSYWHSFFSSKVNETEPSRNFATAEPNIGAGIGHQMANWIAGYWWSKQFNLGFAHTPFSNSKWENFLGFGESNVSLNELLNQGYKKVKLPLFNEGNSDELIKIKNIIQSYSKEKVVFIFEQDQFYEAHYGVSEDIKKMFYNSVARKNDTIQYNKNAFNIAVHVRRTVIIDNKVIEEDEQNKAKRWLSNDYYEKVLNQVLENIKVDKPIAIWLFSTGKPEEFAEFQKYGEVHFCSDMDEYQSFAHLVFADLLITSKSSFSYKPALMNSGIKVCPRNFWHGYPDAADWILCENDGSFDIEKLKSVVK